MLIDYYRTDGVDPMLLEDQLADAEMILLGERSNEDGEGYRD